MAAELFDLIAGHYAIDCLSALQQVGALAELRSPATAAELADRLQLDEAVLAGLLDFLASTSSVLVPVPGGYRLAADYRSSQLLEFHLDKFVGGYGPAAGALGEVLRDPMAGSGLVAGDRLARAFAAVREQTPTVMAQLVQSWEVESLADLGCGAGGLLIELAMANEVFVGWGFDANPAMVARATAAARAAEVADRLTFATVDVRTMAELPAGALTVQAVHGRSLLNAFFRTGGAEAAGVLADIRERFAGKLLFIEDYYGQLGTATDGRATHTMLQDLAQLASGQGVPLPDLAGWLAVYRQGGYGVLEAYEGTNAGIHWFVHVCAPAQIGGGAEHIELSAQGGS